VLFPGGSHSKSMCWLNQLQIGRGFRPKGFPQERLRSEFRGTHDGDGGYLRYLAWTEPLLTSDCTQHSPAAHILSSAVGIGRGSLSSPPSLGPAALESSTKQIDYGILSISPRAVHSKLDVVAQGLMVLFRK